jgi:hypothetical protein
MKCYTGPVTSLDSLEQPKQRKMVRMLGIRNVIGHCRTGSLASCEEKYRQDEKGATLNQHVIIHYLLEIKIMI